MLAILKKTFIINSLLIFLVVLISILTIHWHHQMYELHNEEKLVSKKYEHLNAINRQLLMEYSELESGVLIYQKSKQDLKMIEPIKIDEVSI
jgi:cell division protein FtsL